MLWKGLIYPENQLGLSKKEGVDSIFMRALGSPKTTSDLRSQLILRVAESQVQYSQQKPTYPGKDGDLKTTSTCSLKWHLFKVYDYILKGHISHMGVDQNKRAWERYNRRSTANQSRTHRWQSRRDFVVSNVICTENEIDISIYTEIYTSHNLEEIGKRHGMAMGQWLHLGVPQSPHNRGSIAAQSRICRSKTWKLGLQKDWHCKCCVCLGK